MRASEEVVSSRGPGAAGRDPGASRDGQSGRGTKGSRRGKQGGQSGRGAGREAERGGEGLTPLNAWAQLLTGRLGDPRFSGGSGAQAEAVRVWRCDTLRLHPTPEQELLLRRAGDAVARMINMENYRRRQLFFEEGRIDKSWRSAWERRRGEYADIYRLLGSRNFHEVCRVISEQWRSFAELLKAMKKGRLEPWQIVHPPGYRKQDGQRLPIIFVRFDDYKVDPERRVLRLKYWNVELRFTGKLRWHARPGAKQGRLVIVYDPVRRKWYAKVGVEVLLQRSSTPGLKAGVDLGREILAAVAIEDGMALLYRAAAVKSDYYYFERRISEVDRTLSDPRSEEMDRAVLWERRRWLYNRRRRDHIFANVAAHLAKTLRARGVGVVFVGYPRGIAQERAGKGNSNMWGYWKLIMRLAVTLENHGIAAFAVSEDGTSSTCARHGCKVARRPRGLVWCPHGHVAHADLNAALNILARGLSALGLTAEPPARVKVLSFLPTPSRVIEPRKKNHNPALKAG